MATTMTNKAQDIYKIPGNTQEYTINATANVTKYVPALKVTKTPDNNEVELNDIIPYTLEVENTGEIPYTKIVITDALASQLEFVTGSLIFPAGWTASGTDITTGITLSGATLDSGAKLSLGFSAKVIAVLPPATIPNQGKATGYFKLSTDTTERTIVDVTDVPSNLVAAICIKPDFTIIKTVTPIIGQNNDILTFTIAVTNTGNKDLLKFVLQDTLPGELVYQIGTLKGSIPPAPSVALPDTLATGVEVGTIPVGQQYVAHFDAKVAATDKMKDVTNVAAGSGKYTKNGTEYSIGPKTDDVSVKIYNVDPYVQLDKKADKSFVQQGDTVEYTLTFTNNSQLVMDSVTISDVVPAGMSDAGTTKTQTFTNVGVGASVVFKFTVTVLSIPPITFVNSLGKADYSYTEPETSRKRSGTVTAPPVTINGGKVDITKAITPNQGVKGDVLLCTITVHSISPSSKNTIKEDLTLAPELEIIPTGNHIFINSTDTGSEATLLLGGYDIGAMNAGDTKVVTFNVRIK